MKYEKVEINIDDSRKFQDIALLVDREDFLEDLSTFRKIYDSKPHTAIDGYFPPPEIYEIRTKYKYPISFIFAIWRVATENRISDRDVKDLYGEEIAPYQTRSIEKKIPIYINDEEIFIRVTPGVPLGKQKKVILESLRKYLDRWNKSHPLFLDTKPEMRRDREWYWEKRMGKSYGKIAREYEDKYNLQDQRDVIIKAIKHYEKALNMEI